MGDVRCGAAYFDPALRAWVLSRYSDVAAALRTPQLVVPGAGAEPHAARLAVQKVAAHEFSRARLAAWRASMERTALRSLADLSAERPVELVHAFAEPWSLALALQVAKASPADAAELTRCAREVFQAAAQATDAGVSPGARAAAGELARLLSPAQPGAGASLRVQAFVALSQTLPCLLAAAWHALVRHPEQMQCLRAEPARMPAAVEELLRYAGPARAVFRAARQEVCIGGATIRPGERAVLMLAAANRDPAHVPEPDRLEVRRRPNGHLAFGGGSHACVGAALIRMALAVATEALLRTTVAVEDIGAGEVWTGGFAIRAPASLWAVLRRGASSPPRAVGISAPGGED